MSKKNEERKLEIYDFINNYIRKKGISPTTSEICEELGIAKATVSKYVTRLLDEGLVEKVGRYGLITKESHSPRIRMPIIGSIACGKPKIAFEDIRGYITLDTDIIGEGEYFGLVADGDSMMDAGICDGDIVYVRRQNTADEGDIVVALIEDEETGDTRTTLKRFFRNTYKKSFILHPENPNFEDIEITKIEIIGVAVRALKNL